MVGLIIKKHQKYWKKYLSPHINLKSFGKFYIFIVYFHNDKITIHNEWCLHISSDKLYRKCFKVGELPANPYKKECKICGNKFETFYSWEKVCSEKCRGKLQKLWKRKRPSYHKNWLLRRKIALVKMLGSKCIKCGYSRNYSALVFHHKDPKTKLGNRDWQKVGYFEKLIKENQIELLCANCHMETEHPETSFEPQNL